MLFQTDVANDITLVPVLGLKFMLALWNSALAQFYCSACSMEYAHYTSCCTPHHVHLAYAFVNLSTQVVS